MSSHLIIFLYVFGFGFALAGLLNAIHQTITPQGEDESGHFLLYFDTPAASLWSLVICFFAGPYLILKNGIRFWQLGHVPLTVLLCCVLVSVVWSFCSGIIIIEAGLSLGILNIDQG